MLTRELSIFDPHDLGVLALARIHLGAKGPMSDGELVETLGKHAIRADKARASLLRLERSRQLTFGPCGWAIALAAPRLVLTTRARTG